MTQQKIKELKQSLNSEFQLIHELCIYVLSASQRTNLIRATLATLHAFLSWIPLLETLLKFLSLLPYQNLTLQCLAELRPLTLEIIIIRSTLICIAYSCYYCRLFSHPL